ncbi:MAG: ComEC/Rec2 family competence protein [Muribaculaceae bacterium]|nr:ComEC/Rec2 family competence protein [Muribaculaceae bacterium]
MHKLPFIPALSLSFGIALSSITGLAWWFGAIPVILGIALYFFILYSSSDPISTFKLGKWHAVWVVLIFAGIGMIDEAFATPDDLEKAYRGRVPATVTCEVTGVLTKTYGDRIDVIIAGTNHAKARLRSEATDLSPGDLISVPTKYLRSISKDTTEIGKKTAPMLKASGILYTGFITPTSIDKLGRSKSPRYYFSGIREHIEIKIEKSHLKKYVANFINAILMGDKTGLDERTRLTFAHGGTAHMLALSGLHLGIIASFLLVLLWPLKLLGKYKWVYGAAIILLWTYVFVTGLAYSSVRACIMTTVAFLAIITERKNFAGNALSSACILILLFDPSALFDAGFQLSVVCVGALIIYASRLNPISHRHHPILYFICSILIATMVATGASWALTSYYFSQIPLMFLPTNLFLLPILPFYLFLAMIYVMMLCIGTDCSVLASILNQGYDFMLWLTEKFSGGAEFVVDYQLPLWGVIAWLILFFAAGWWLNKDKTLT